MKKNHLNFLIILSLFLLIKCKTPHFYKFIADAKKSIISTGIKIYKNDQLTFNAYGRWTMNVNAREYVGPEGHGHILPDKKHKWGMLFGRIGSYTFPIGKNQTVISPVNGFLFLFPHKGMYSQYKGKGKLSIYVSIERSARKPIAYEGKKLKIKIIYFTPKNIEVPSNTTNRLRKTLRYIKNFYYQYMKKYGFNNIYDYERINNQIKIYFIKSNNNLKYFNGSNLRIRLKIRKEIIKYMKRKGYNFFNSVYLVICKFGNKKQNLALGSRETFPGGSAFISDSKFFDASLINKTNVKEKVSYIIGAAAHELGHAFGLFHIFKNSSSKGFLMGHGFKWILYKNRCTLSKISASMLNVSPFFQNISESQIADLSPPNILKITKKRNVVKIKVKDNVKTAFAIIRAHTTDRRLHLSKVYNILNKILVINNEISFTPPRFKYSLQIFDINGNITELFNL